MRNKTFFLMAFLPALISAAAASSAALVAEDLCEPAVWEREDINRHITRIADEYGAHKIADLSCYEGTAFHMAALYVDSADDAVLNTLASFGLDLEARNEWDESPIDVATPANQNALMALTGYTPAGGDSQLPLDVDVGDLPPLNTTSTGARSRNVNAVGGGGSGPEDFSYNPPVGTVKIQGGWNFLSHQREAGNDSSLWNYFASDFGVGPEDFSTVPIEFEVAHRLGEKFDFAWSVGHGRKSQNTQYQEDYLQHDTEGVPITQTATLSTTPINFTLKGYLRNRGESYSSLSWIPNTFVPFLSVGGGFILHSFSHSGDFVDTTQWTVDPFTATTSGWDWQGHVAAGANYSFTPKVFVSGEARYTWAKAGVKSDEFLGFSDGLDLSDLKVLVGVGYRVGN